MFQNKWTWETCRAFLCKLSKRKKNMKTSCFNNEKEQTSLYGNITSQRPKNRKTFCMRKHHVTMTKRTNRRVYSLCALFFAAPHSFFNFHSQNQKVFPASSVLSQQPKPIAYNNDMSKDKLTCTSYMIFREITDRFGQYFRSKFHNDFLE